VLSSNTDSKLTEYKNHSETVSKENNSNGNVNGSSEKDQDDKKGSDANKAPCEWKFYSEKTDNEDYKIGFRVQLIHQKVN
jgi:hypothetical protein